MANVKLLSEDRSSKYDISEEDIHIYAEQIGINISTEKHLMWIAEKGLAANVPKPWMILCDKKDRIFYYNPDTHEKSWKHPLDKSFASLVIDERTKSKSLNSASSDYGFESKMYARYKKNQGGLSELKPLESINDLTQTSGRLLKAPLQQLSSLADAPPLSSSGKNSPAPLKRGKIDGGLSAKKIEFGRIENRRGTQLAPVRLNTLKMPAATAPKLNSGMSFMPKGSTLSKNVKRMKEEPEYDNQQDEGPDYGHSHLDDSNESINSDDGSKYSYEETDDEDKHIQGLESYDMLDTSQLSPMYSADESPDALDINSLVQLGTKTPSRFESSLKKDQLETINKENSSLKKVAQPSFLKPLNQSTTKKTANKGAKVSKKIKNKYSSGPEVDYDDGISPRKDNQHSVHEQIQNEWLAMQDEIDKQEKVKYEEMLRESSKRLEEEEIKLRHENAEKISRLKTELQKKIEDEEKEGEKSLQTVKSLNREKISEEEKKLQKELEVLSESLKVEIKKLEEKNASELAQKKIELEETLKKEIENLKILHDNNKKDIEEAHSSEISNLQKAHEQRIKEIANKHGKEVEEVKNKLSDSSSKTSELQVEIQKLEKLMEDETKKYRNLQEEKEKILKEINSEKEKLEKLKKETSENQVIVEDLQDEIEKTENDLDLLRSEKSGLISELNILKENINNEKSNLSNLEKKLKSSLKGASCSTKNLSEVGINTNPTSDMISESVQVSVKLCDASSQLHSLVIPTLDVGCQVNVTHSTSKSCQTDTVPFISSKNDVKVTNYKRHSDSDAVVDKGLENALAGLSMKLDSRINGIENQLRMLQEHLSRPAASQSMHSSQELQNQFTEVKSIPNSETRNVPPIYFTDSSIPPELFPNNTANSSQNKCKCELGDSASCDVLQDVKNSIYRLNNILSANYVPPPRSSSLYQVNQSIIDYSSPFDNFYSQFRQMQEKHRLTELKHKCENEAVKLTKGNGSDAKVMGNLDNESLKPSYHSMHSDIFSYNFSEDPLIRARSIVLREQAKSWKEQQLLNVSPQFFPMNSSPVSLQSSNTGFTSPHNVPSSHQTFLNFEVDPETDYNMWMTRLNALQLRIRSHKLL